MKEQGRRFTFRTSDGEGNVQEFTIPAKNGEEADRLLRRSFPTLRTAILLRGTPKVKEVAPVERVVKGRAFLEPGLTWRVGAKKSG